MNYDVLILGAGVSGLSLAWELGQQGYRVAVCSSGESASSWAQGGVVFKGEGDPGSLRQDIFESGCHINFPEAVDLVCTQGPQRIKQLLFDQGKVPFDDDLTLEAAHSTARILHVKDHTGKSIQNSLHDLCASCDSIDLIEGCLIDLLLTDKHSVQENSRFSRREVFGAYIYQKKNRQVQAYTARATVLATGGFSNLYMHATGPETSLGNGVSAAHRAGARTMNLEYVQFHPTALYVEGEPRSLLTEALRGQGAVILNKDKKEFVDSLAPRDVVARAIHHEIFKRGDNHVWLDISRIKDFNNKFPSIAALIKKYNLKSNLLPIVPAAHYTIGGVWTDMKAQTNLDSLWAIGEVSCTGLHGANRLASTSLLEGLVFSKQAFLSIDQQLKQKQDNSDLYQARKWSNEESEVDEALIAQDWMSLQQTMWNYVGLVRSEKRLKRAEKILVALRNEIEDFYRKCRISEDLIRLRHAVLLSNLVLYAAIKNRKSLGTHYILDEKGESLN